ncbi:MAG: hypothetical protein J5I90_22400 [Caldilineales bacterium]|nr:hypothetical protein [Caldilineales bacterium]
MTKKSSSRKRRHSKPNVPVYPTPTTPSETREAIQPRTESMARTSQPAVGEATVDWQGEYGYVLSDLRNMLIVAAAMVVLLLALNFIIA